VFRYVWAPVTTGTGGNYYKPKLYQVNVSMCPRGSTHQFSMDKYWMKIPFRFKHWSWTNSRICSLMASFSRSNSNALIQQPRPAFVSSFSNHIHLELDNSWYFPQSSVNIPSWSQGVMADKWKTHGIPISPWGRYCWTLLSMWCHKNRRLPGFSSGLLLLSCLWR